MLARVRGQWSGGWFRPGWNLPARTKEGSWPCPLGPEIEVVEQLITHFSDEEGTVT
jgi:hypothetical protein